MENSKQAAKESLRQMEASLRGMMSRMRSRTDVNEGRPVDSIMALYERMGVQAGKYFTPKKHDEAGRKFGDVLIKLGMFQRSSLIGAAACRYGGVLQMLDAERACMEERMHKEAILQIQQMHAFLKQDLAKITQEGVQENSDEMLAYLTAKLEPQLLSHLVAMITLQQSYFENCLSLFKQLDQVTQTLTDMQRKPVEARQTLKLPTTEHLLKFSQMMEEERQRHEREQARQRQAPMFGVPLRQVVESPENQGNPTPLLIDRVIEFLRARALEDVGLFRLSGSSSEIAELKADCNSGVIPDLFRARDPNSVAALLKLFLRELPDCILTLALYEDFVTCVRDAPDWNSRLRGLEFLVGRLPPCNYAVLNQLMIFFQEVVALADINKMTPDNLAIIFGPVLLKPEGDDQTVQAKMILDTQAQCQTVATMIQHWDAIQRKPEQQQQQHATYPAVAAAPQSQGSARSVGSDEDDIAKKHRTRIFTFDPSQLPAGGVSVAPSSSPGSAGMSPPSRPLPSPLRPTSPATTATSPPSRPLPTPNRAVSPSRSLPTAASPPSRPLPTPGAGTSRSQGSARPKRPPPAPAP